MADLSKLSTEDLMALKSGDLTKVSTAGLMALKQSPPQEPQEPPREAPGSQPLPPISDRLMSMGGAMGRGLIGGGPVGAAVAGVGEGMKQFGGAMDRAAYNVGGAVTDALSPRFSPEVAAGAGFAANVGTQMIPTAIGGIAGKTLGEPVLDALSRRIMRSALKPNAKEIRVGDAGRAVQTLFDEGANVTRGGAQKLERVADEMGNQVSQKIAGSTGMVDKAYPASALAKTLRNFEDQVTPLADRNAILGSWGEFSGLHGNKIPVQEAQKLKQGTYRVLRGKFGEQGSASTEAQKALARGLREGIEGQVPEVAALNAREGNALNALEMVERRVGTAASRDIGGLAWIANDPKAAAAFLAGRSETIKSILARLLQSGKERIPQTAGMIGGAGIGAYQGQPE